MPAGYRALGEEMSEDREATEDRRRFLKFVGGTAVFVPIVGLTGCSGGKEDAPAAAAPEAGGAKTAAGKEIDPPAKAGGMPTLSEDDPQAKSLSYVHEATTIDAARQPRYQSGQICANCALYQGKGGEEWAGCSIFPGKLVKASGWCSVYAPKPA